MHRGSGAARARATRRTRVLVRDRAPRRSTASRRCPEARAARSRRRVTVSRPGLLGEEVTVPLDLAAQPEARELAPLHARTVRRAAGAARRNVRREAPFAARTSAGNAASQLSAIGSRRESGDDPHRARERVGHADRRVLQIRHVDRRQQRIALAQRIAVRRRVEIDGPVQTVGDDDRRDLAALQEEGRDGIAGARATSRCVTMRAAGCGSSPVSRRKFCSAHACARRETPALECGRGDHAERIRDDAIVP